MKPMPEELDPRILPVSEARKIAERSGYLVQVVPANLGGVTLNLVPGRIRLITAGDRVTDVIFH